MLMIWYVNLKLDLIIVIWNMRLLYVTCSWNSSPISKIWFLCLLILFCLLIIIRSFWQELSKLRILKIKTDSLKKNILTFLYSQLTSISTMKIHHQRLRKRKVQNHQNGMFWIKILNSERNDEHYQKIWPLFVILTFKDKLMKVSTQQNNEIVLDAHFQIKDLLINVKFVQLHQMDFIQKKIS